MAITGAKFWDTFLRLIGDTKSVRSYYLPNSGEGIDGNFAQAGEWANVIDKLFERTAPNSTERRQAVDLLDQAGFWAPTDDLSFWIGQDVNSADLNDLRNAAEARFPSLFGSDDLVGDDDTVGTIDDDPAPDPIGEDETIAGIMGGGSLTKIIRAGQDDLWAITYLYAGIQHIYTFASFEDMERSLGAGAWGSGLYTNLVLDEADVNNDSGTSWILGDADTFIGQPGTYQAYFSDIMREAGLEAGSRNPGWAGRWANDPDVQRIIAMSQAGNWGEIRQTAELRLTSIYQELYPGIDAFLRSGLSNPEGAWHNYMSEVTEGLSSLGYAMDSDGTYRSLVGDMLGNGISAEKFNTFVPTFVRAEQSPEFASALNKWTEQDLGLSITFEDWFDVLDGNTTPEIAAVVEKATLSFTAERSGTTLSDAQITRLAGLTNLSEDQMRVAFTTAEEALLSVGRRDLARFGLSVEALVSSAFEIGSVNLDPFSTDGTTFTATEIKRRARKAATELGIQDDRKGQFFVGFDAFGAPTRRGLLAASPEIG